LISQNNLQLTVAESVIYDSIFNRKLQSDMPSLSKKNIEKKEILSVKLRPSICIANGGMNQNTVFFKID
jgi:hypothetical protein